ncbi:MAG: hypothetical protein NTV51_32595 [Verrucomicrobia bacterium]|nr:hypothetical protein [Verrucomicrobiota bacterium]
MITRPLDLAAHLRPAPRSQDWLFFVNAGLIVLFFSLFGARFVLAPGIGLDVPTMPGAMAGAVRTTHRISVLGADLIYVDEGAMNARQLVRWFEREAKKTKDPSLLMLIAPGVPTTVSVDIAQAARTSGFVRVQWGAQEPASRSAGGR